MMENELKPCPFCGGQAELREYLAFGRIKSYTVRCKNMCAVTCGHRNANGKWRATQKKEAIETWNRRTNENEDNNNND